MFLIFFWLITPFESGLVQSDVYYRTKFDIEPLHSVYFVKYDVTVSFLAQVLDTVTYFVSQVLDTAS